MLCRRPTLARCARLPSLITFRQIGTRQGPDGTPFRAFCFSRGAIDRYVDLSTAPCSINQNVIDGAELSVSKLERQAPSVEHQPSHATEERIRLFSDRYGARAFEELLQLFALPCVTYAEIAKRFGVSRERVRQWHLTIAPDSPRGHERRRLCQSHRQRRQLLDEPVYRAFVRAARAGLSDARVRPVVTRTGFRKRVVRLGTWTVALKKATRRRDRGVLPLYSLTGSRGASDYLFFLLDDESYLFLPSSQLPRAGTTYVDDAVSKYHAFKNTLAVRASTKHANKEPANTSGTEEATRCCES